MKKRGHIAPVRGEAGTTLVELIAMTGVLALVISALFCAFTVANQLFRAGDMAVNLEEQGRLALTRICAELKQTGYYYDESSGKDYPYIFANATADGLFADYTHTPAQHDAEEGTVAHGTTKEIVFRLAADVDGDGYKTDASTGQIEWSADEISYQLRTDDEGVNYLERRVNNAAPEVIASHVERITFDTIYSDSSVPYGQVRVVIHLRKTDTDGRVIKASYSSIFTSSGERFDFMGTPCFPIYVSPAFGPTTSTL